MTTSRVLVYTSMQPIRRADMDMLGHVNDVVYFRYMEQARIEWLYSLAGATSTARQHPLPDMITAPLRAAA